ncbi:hypothetical protein CPT_Mansal_031 [Salmonella phage Mansal]|nr:hypothetical protein CPT_Mansal_035 [Salmonella phage Mansal]
MQDRVGHNFDGSGTKDPASPIDMVYEIQSHQSCNQTLQLAFNVFVSLQHLSSTFGPNEAGRQKHKTPLITRARMWLIATMLRLCRRVITLVRMITVLRT